MKAGVAEKLPVEDSFCTNVPELMELVSTLVEKYLVVIRAQTQRQHTEEEIEKRLNENSKVILSIVELQDEMESIFRFDDDLFQELKDRVKRLLNLKVDYSISRLKMSNSMGWK